MKQYKIRKMSSKQDELAALTQISISNPTLQQQLQELQQEESRANQLKQETKTAQGCKFTWIILYYCTAVLGLVGIIYFGIGTSSTVNYGESGFDFGKKIEKQVMNYVNNSLKTFDKTISNFIGANTTFCDDFVNKDR